ncbi:MAG TPA: serine protease [Phycisphaerales bacterium]|nr:serine protease [Phycisphaerales bacterium]
MVCYRNIVEPLIQEPSRWTYVRDWVNPTLVRLDSPRRAAGRGVTIAVIDAGFYPHPDLLYPTSRVLCHKDFSVDEEPLDGRTDAGNWHGTMTAVIAAGNGFLSQGLYRGPAYLSNLLLLKVGEKLSIRAHNVAKALRWVLDNRENYNIRVANISLGVGEEDRRSQDSLVDHWIRRLTEAGICVVVAAGNSGGPVGSPAKCPEAITVGGYFDHCDEMFNSDFGFTPDRVLKPDLIAPSALVASPILPGTPQQKRAAAICRLLADPACEDESIIKDAQLPESYLKSSPEDRGNELLGQAAGHKVVGTYYEHADGTSVAAPMVSGTIAQLLELRPELTPAEVRRVLLQTSRRLAGASRERQGRGILKAAEAFKVVLEENHPVLRHVLGPERLDNQILIKTYQPDAEKVEIAGDFTNWELTPMEKDEDGIWSYTLELPISDGEKRAYKFLYDGKNWEEDRHNPYCEPDRMGGLNSLIDRELLLLRS